MCVLILVNSIQNYGELPTFNIIKQRSVSINKNKDFIKNSFSVSLESWRPAHYMP